MREHALDREVSFARIGRPENGRDAGPTKAYVTTDRGGEGDGPQGSGKTRRERSPALRYVSVSQRAVEKPVIKMWNESGTNRARIGDSVPVCFRSRDIWLIR